MSLLATPDGNKYFNNHRDYVDYIREKCGYEVSEYVRELDDIACYDVLDFSESVYTNMKDLYETVVSINEKTLNVGAMIHSNPILKLKLYNKMKQLLEDLEGVLFDSI